MPPSQLPIFLFLAIIISLSYQYHNKNRYAPIILLNSSNNTSFTSPAYKLTALRVWISGHPKHVVKSPCGSASTRRTFFPAVANPTPRFTVVVVLPVPPLLIRNGYHLAFSHLNLLLSDKVIATLIFRMAMYS